jgi:hypothetical protein
MAKFLVTGGYGFIGSHCNRSESPQHMLTSLLKSEEVVRPHHGDEPQ